MGFTFTTKPKTKTTTGGGGGSSSENWMGFLLVFFPENESSQNEGSPSRNDILLSSSSSPSCSSSSSLSSPLPRIRSANSSSLLFTKAQSTISICALLVFLTLLLFTLSTFEPSLPSPAPVRTPRRFLSQNSHANTPPFSLFTLLNRKSHGQNQFNFNNNISSNPVALQGMGALYRRGTRAMNDLIICHVTEDTTGGQFRLFLRVLHRSGLTAKSDVVFLFPTSSLLSRFGSVIEQENDSFIRLARHYNELNETRKDKSVLDFELTQFVKYGKKDTGEPLWGKKIRANNSDSAGEHVRSQSTQLSYGSVIGFEADELDPENSLAGFLDHLPMRLRRWACYPMILGRVRRNFKHVLLIDVKNTVLHGDPLGRVRSQSQETVYVSMQPESKHSGRKNSERAQSTRYSVNSAVLMGGSRGVRRFSSAVLTEIVRAAMQHKKKNPVTESGVLSQLVGNGHLLKNVDLITSTEPVPDGRSLTEPSPKSGLGVVQRRGSSNHDLVDSVIMKKICSCEIESSVYRNC